MPLQPTSRERIEELKASYDSAPKHELVSWRSRNEQPGHGHDLPAYIQTVASAERAEISNGEGLGISSPEFAPERVTVQAPKAR